MFIGRRLRAGDRQADVARRLGKSRPYVLYGTALLDAPDWLLHLYRQGVCRGLRELHELRRLAEVQPGPVMLWSNQQTSIGRSDIQALRRSLGADPDSTDATAEAATTKPAADTASSSSADAQVAKSSGRLIAAAGERSESRLLLARMAGAAVAILADSANVPDGMVAVRHLATGARQVVRPESLALMGVYADPKCRETADTGAADFSPVR